MFPTLQPPNLIISAREIQWALTAQRKRYRNWARKVTSQQGQGRLKRCRTIRKRWNVCGCPPFSLAPNMSRMINDLCFRALYISPTVGLAPLTFLCLPSHWSLLKWCLSLAPPSSPSPRFAFPRALITTWYIIYFTVRPCLPPAEWKLCEVTEPIHLVHSRSETSRTVPITLQGLYKYLWNEWMNLPFSL